MEDDLWWKTTLNGDADTDADTETDTDTDTENDTNTYGGRVIMGEVSPQKSFPYSDVLYQNWCVSMKSSFIDGKLSPCQKIEGHIHRGRDAVFSIWSDMGKSSSA